MTSISASLIQTPQNTVTLISQDWVHGFLSNFLYWGAINAGIHFANQKIKFQHNPPLGRHIFLCSLYGRRRNSLSWRSHMSQTLRTLLTYSRVLMSSLEC